MKRIFLAIFALLAAATVFPQTAVFKELSGKVEYQLAGQEWRPAKAGAEVPKGTMISTGFKSMALIALGNASVLVKPLTRLTIEEIVRVEGSEAARLFLIAGRVRAEITPESGKTLDFSVRSSTATASVRGSGFDFDSVNLEKIRGKTRFVNLIGQSRTILDGETSKLANDGTVEAPRKLQEQRSVVIGTSDFGFTSGDSGVGIIPPALGVVFIIEIQ